ncbi:3-O-alpha-D-mannopyranosyl-alpha-D-mannopyranose xylosylphosphotransferase [Kwoniella shivajii]|uniref:3-O-alpha-D-mannopyranosyl-alpha-D-mannopyranose xylosylphosphotransferase n=1 Tax=Kwoniella shivajii TaxID=564305 RepID=A0ABZ1CSD7_9TREE|nr:3-O-alpha-D-mannopyranosyl-alpha-D-mannopyranose xylosylphosphotransferase [Kwoniella shivajii]
MFKRLAFSYPECGDCLTMALVTASGPLGLSAFFPPKGTTFENQPLAPGQSYPRYLPPPHLPLTPTWHEADFSLETVMSTTALPGESVNLREFTMKLLSRYQYLSAKSVSHFHMLKSAEHAHRVFKMIQDNPQVSILGLNDDIEEDYEEVKDIMQEWFELRWPKKAVWERDWDPVKDKLED